ncbi:MAG: acyl carrier protein [Flavobacteriales bacterium]|nr:acyl carrier protein [Flavobacteriales bacterium]HQW40480.1 acyl carrier protein [Flavobacteriales bacterium]
MNSAELQIMLQDRLAPRMDRLGLAKHEFTNDLDLLRIGILDSLAFVDLITELETALGMQVDLEKAFDRPGATTIGGVIELFLNGK